MSATRHAMANAAAELAGAEAREAKRSEELDAAGDALAAWLRAEGAVGRRNAIHQAAAAAALKVATRRLQDVTLRLNERGVPVCSAVVEPMGIYLAETVEELADYGEQLRSRLIGNAHRLRCVQRMARDKAAEYPVDPVTGQRRLW